MPDAPVHVVLLAPELRHARRCLERLDASVLPVGRSRNRLAHQLRAALRAVDAALEAAEAGLRERAQQANTN